MRKYLLNLFILSACHQGVCIVTMLSTTEKGMTIRDNHRLTVFKADLGATETNPSGSCRTALCRVPGMHRYLTTCLMAMTLLVTLTSCSIDEPVPVPPETEQPAPPAHPDEPGNDDTNNPTNNPMSNNLKISVGSFSFTVTLENNATVTAFKALLPMTVNMAEMNGNEKYYYLPENLPAASSRPGTIQTGDLMLYGSSCLVLFYESFRTSYSYTRLGRVDNPSGLVSALGSGSANVTFELQ